MLTIGAFAKASRLSPKALRLYDQLGLLTPARVDPSTGYRLYAPEQLERARLVAWLRRLGMPLARIKHVCELDARGAACEVRDFWEQVEAETAERRDLASFLVEHLSGMPGSHRAPEKEHTMSRNTAPLEIRYAALSDTGLVRESNQDTAYAGSGVLAVADGFGKRGGPASAAAVDVLRRLDAHAPGTHGGGGAGPVPAGDLLNVLEEAIERADEAVRGIAASSEAPHEVGTTLTAMLWTGSQLALVHVGDSRAYLLRGGELFQITHDHTLVQSMVDEGRLAPEEATTHPQRALLARALTGGDAGVVPDTRLCDAEPGDRYLLCSDGLTAAVPTGTVHQVLASPTAPEPAVRELVTLANRNGGPDNVSCVIADVLRPRR
ncbi:MerR family transcriptional regulator [Streptomyces iconiensis]|uniref:MerR family transcriptional regulator n=1 Tax=Streptomyces iconiensis TaxID=1384038 RepID=A0ABT7A5J9_9ACTN|nr:MerR family transcriptional regulator [Streptomyces iconiensis]MDJ1135898.1 MerR family transcriptional regulator [Streptomyces iconiensis]